MWKLLLTFPGYYIRIDVFFYSRLDIYNPLCNTTIKCTENEKTDKSNDEQQYSFVDTSSKGRL